MKKPRTIRPSRPNAGLEAAYRARLLRVVDEMNRSVLHWVRAAYRASPPAMALDSSADVLGAAIRKLTRRQRRRFDQLSKDLAEWFARSAVDRSDAALRAALKKGGMTVKFNLTPAARDILDATVNENVALIKSIPQQYLTQVETIVMQSVKAGRDLSDLSDKLQHQFGVTRRRAALISRDQNNKATAAITAARQGELGIERAIWVHSHGGKHPRPSHLKNDGNSYDVRRGWYDPDEKEHILPGQLLNCRCVSRSIVPGLT